MPSPARLAQACASLFRRGYSLLTNSVLTSAPLRGALATWRSHLSIRSHLILSGRGKHPSARLAKAAGTSRTSKVRRSDWRPSITQQVGLPAARLEKRIPCGESWSAVLVSPRRLPGKNRSSQSLSIHPPSGNPTKGGPCLRPRPPELHPLCHARNTASIR